MSLAPAPRSLCAACRRPERGFGWFDPTSAKPPRPSVSFCPITCHVWSNDKVRVTAGTVSASTVDLATAPLSVQVSKRRGAQLQVALGPTEGLRA